jgi:hypothetical protein
VFTAEVKLVPSAQHVAPSGDCSSLRVAAQTFWVLAPDSTSLREEFQQWRLQEGLFGWAPSTGILNRLAARERYRRGPPHS